MSLIMERLDLGLPLTVDRILRATRQLGHSKFYTPHTMPKAEKDELLSFLKSQSKKIGGYKTKQCYYNSQMLMLNTQHHSVFSDKIKYCEGYWMREGLPIAIPHAWLIYDDQYVVDVTLTTNNSFDPRDPNLKDRILGMFPNDWEYYGLIIDRAEILGNLLKMGESISFLDDYRIANQRVNDLEKELKSKI